LSSTYTHQLYTRVNDLPETWNHVAESCIFLQSNYLGVLEKSSPANMQCTFVGVFEKDELIATVLFQEINLALLTTFGDRDHYILTRLRNFLFRQYASKLLLVGNNMLSGQNAYCCLHGTNEEKVLETIKDICVSWPQKPHLTIFKDFTQDQTKAFNSPKFTSDYLFSSQPNMIFEIKSNWKREEDYILDLTKKYRDQFKRCRKKGSSLSNQELSLEEIIQNEENIYSLYLHVAINSPFNTFILPFNHFSIFKKQLGSDFILRGYYENEKLVGFTSVIRHGEELETYFLGYDVNIQREKMLYLNMLYDIIDCGISQGFKRIILGRTALEIKSSIGAKPVELNGFMRHSYSLVHSNLPWIFPLLEPKAKWIQRHPFKD
jgi:hypothetical protein